MKNKKLKAGAVFLIVALLVGTFSLSLVSFSESSDPLVTLSYLTDIILPQMKKDILMEIAVQGGDSGETTPPVSGEDTDTPNAPSGAYTLLELENGQKVYTNSVLEFIVRPGSDVQVISPFEEQGIADITNGNEYLDGDTVEINAYCLIPRGGDGRGIEILNEKSYILVRGEYYIG